MKTFLHAGDMGDIIYALPTIRAFGGGILYLDTSGGEDDHHVAKQVGWRKRLKFNEACYVTLESLLEIQPYIFKVERFKGQNVDINLNAFRRRLRTDNRENLMQSHLKHFGFKLKDSECTPWLTVPDSAERFERTIVINRSLRYHTAHIMWDSIVRVLEIKADFIGSPFEHEVFCKTFNIEIPHFQCKDALALAQRIKAAETFIGNQSMPMSLRIGMGLSFAQESYAKAANCIFEGMDATYYFN